MTHDWNVCTLLPLFAGQTVSILNASRGICIPGTVMHWLQHRSYLVCTTAGAVYHHTWKHLWDRVLTKPDHEPASARDTSHIYNKEQAHMHAPQEPYMLYAPAAAPPKLVAHQCITPSEQACTPAKPAAAARHSATRVQYNQYWTKGSSSHPTCHPPRFLLTLLVIPQWQHTNPATSDVCENTWFNRCRLRLTTTL